MAPRIGYLLPTREFIMAGRPQAKPLLELAERAAGLNFDSIWAGDSLLARPRHEPLTLLAAVASRLPNVNVGTAVLLPAMRNPVLLAHQVATLDQIAEGRLILGVGIAADVANIRAEFCAAGVPFEKRVGRLLLLWPFHGYGLAAGARAVERSARRLGRTLEGRARRPCADTTPCSRPADLDRGITAGQP